VQAGSHFIFITALTYYHLLSQGKLMEETNHDDAANHRMSSPIKRRFSLNEDGEMRKVALLTGVTGQDGSYLAELLLDKVRVHKTLL